MNHQIATQNEMCSLTYTENKDVENKHTFKSKFNLSVQQSIKQKQENKHEREWKNIKSVMGKENNAIENDRSSELESSFTLGSQLPILWFGYFIFQPKE